VAKLLLIELNEINFDFVAEYVRQGRLPVLRTLIARHGVRQTTSEMRYEHLEPWIQWVTAHTGLSFPEHKVFRLGDIVDHEIPQIWELLEEAGYKVGAISPMNAKNRTRNAAFFVPDPWTKTSVTGTPLLRRLHRAICDAVNANAEFRVTPGTAAALLAGLVAYARPCNYAGYFRLGVAAAYKRWMRALLLDVLLGDVFIRLTQRTRPDFATLFVNAGAHIQHHYMFNSAAYGGTVRNPDWYVRAGQDPVLDAYEAYDAMIGQIVGALHGYRVMIATGLHQKPYEKITFYWRLRDHQKFLDTIGLKRASVEPLMSRDFVVHFDDAGRAANAEAVLASARAFDGTSLFTVDNRGRSLFVMLTYPRDIRDDFPYEVGGRRYTGLEKHVVFVAIKNGEHHGTGYFIDTGERAGEPPAAFHLAELPERVTRVLAQG
jgi:hypothetical protein